MFGEYDVDSRTCSNDEPEEERGWERGGVVGRENEMVEKEGEAEVEDVGGLAY